MNCIKLILTLQEQPYLQGHASLVKGMQPGDELALAADGWTVMMQPLTADEKKGTICLNNNKKRKKQQRDKLDSLT